MHIMSSSHDVVLHTIYYTLLRYYTVLCSPQANFKACWSLHVYTYSVLPKLTSRPACVYVLCSPQANFKACWSLACMCALYRQS